MEYSKIIIAFIAGLVVGGGGGYYVGGITSIVGNTPQEEVTKEAPASDNPFAEVKTNPLEDVKLNPFE